MTRTQIQLPDDIHAQTKSVASAWEISLAELTRRGLEYMLSVYAPPGTAAAWEPPKPRRLGWKGLSDAQIKEEAQRVSGEPGPGRRR